MDTEAAHIDRKKKLLRAVQKAITEDAISRRRAKEKRINPELVVFEHDTDLQVCIELLRTQPFQCTVTNCRCEVDFEAFAVWSHLRPPAPVREILSHTLHNGEVWLYCQLDTDKAVPEFRRQCQLDIDMVRNYRAQLLQNQRSPRIEEVWTAEDEKTVRRKVFIKLDKKQELINQQLAQCETTVEWADLTNNARDLKNIKLHCKTNSRPGPVKKEGAEVLYTVERILGCVINQGKLWFLIKWEGWDSKDNSWEPESAFNGCQEMGLVASFFAKFGKATWKNPKVLSPEGEEHVKWVEKAVELKKKKKVEVAKLTPIPVRAASSPPSRPTQSSILTTSLHKKKMKTEHKCETKSPVTSRPGPVPDHPENEFYEVERVIGAELYHGKVFYLIKWLGWEDEFDTWEPASGVKLAKNALKDFTTKHGKPTKETPKILSDEGKAFSGKIQKTDE